METSHSELATLEEQMLGGVVTKRGRAIFQRGEGMYLFDTEGRKYLDFTSAQGIAFLGHAHPVMQQALASQASQLMSLPSFLYGETRGRFLRKLAEILPRHLPHVYLCNSGTEAVEAALKFARLATGRTSLVATRKGFHGRTAGAFSLTWSPKTKDQLVPLLPAVTHTTYNQADMLADAVTEKTAGLFLEVVQGEGGVNVGQTEFLQRAQQVCQSRAALLIIDEIQTGFGRTGRWFGFQHADLRPDLVCMAKGLGAGFPMGAVAFTPAVKEKLFVGAHGSTFGGNPLACAAGLTALTAYQELDTVGNALHMGAYLLQGLREKTGHLKIVRDIRGKGLLLGIELRTHVRPFLQTLMLEQGVLMLNAGPRILRLLPPLILEQCHADAAIDAVSSVLAAAS